MSEPAPLWVRFLARLVPASRREEWRREWSGEAAHARGSGSGLRVATTALEDALALRAHDLGAGLRTGSLIADFRYAARSLLRSPGFTAVVVVTLGLGLGAVVTLFSAARGTVFRPLPWQNPEQVALVTTGFSGHDEMSVFPASEPEYLALREGNPAFEALAGFTVGTSNVGGLASPRRGTVVSGTANLLSVLGVEPALGRSFLDGEDRPGAERVALLTHGFWRDAFGADSGVLGRTVEIDGRPHQVIGVLRPDFEFPGAEPDLVRTTRIDPTDPGRASSHWISMLARLSPGLDAGEARVQTDAFLERLAADWPEEHGLSGDGHPVLITDVREAVTGDMERPLRVLSAAVFLVLLVACLNVASLLVVRGEDRRREFGVRTALGAGRATLVRQLLAESALLAVAGGALGVALAAGALRALTGLAAGTLPPNTTLSLDGVVLALTAVVVAGVAVVFGLVPVLTGERNLTGVLREGGAKTTSGRRRMVFRRGLVVIEVAAAVALIAGAGVLGRGLNRLLAVDAGMDAAGVVLFDLELNAAGYPGATEVAVFHQELRRRAEALPEVEAVSSIRTAPLSGAGGWESLEVAGETPPVEGDARNWNVQYQVADPGAFRALGVPVRSGRTFREGDAAGSPPVVVVNEAAVRTLWGDGVDPLGRELRLGGFPGNTNPFMRVVGVVGDTRQTSLDQSPPPQIFVPRAQAGAIYDGLGTRSATIIARTRGDTGAALTALRGVVGELDPQLPFASPRTFRQQVQRSVGDRRFLAVLTGAFSGVAGLLGAVGLYGLVAYIVRQRRHEFGIRYALGAGRRAVVGGVVAEAGALIVAGSVVGVALAWASAGILEGLAYGVAVRDPLAFTAAPLALVTVGLLAAWVPARRASRVDPARVLREE